MFISFLFEVFFLSLSLSLVLSFPWAISQSQSQCVPVSVGFVVSFVHFGFEIVSRLQHFLCDEHARVYAGVSVCVWESVWMFDQKKFQCCFCLYLIFDLIVMLMVCWCCSVLAHTERGKNRRRRKKWKTKSWTQRSTSSTQTNERVTNWLFQRSENWMWPKTHSFTRNRKLFSLCIHSRTITFSCFYLMLVSCVRNDRHK